MVEFVGSCLNHQRGGGAGVVLDRGAVLSLAHYALPYHTQQQQQQANDGGFEEEGVGLLLDAAKRSPQTLDALILYITTKPSSSSSSSALSGVGSLSSLVSLRNPHMDSLLHKVGFTMMV